MQKGEWNSIGFLGVESNEVNVEVEAIFFNGNSVVWIAVDTILVIISCNSILNAASSTNLSLAPVV